MKQILIILLFLGLFSNLSAQRQDSSIVQNIGQFGEKHIVDSLFSDYDVPTNATDNFNISKNWWVIILIIIGLIFFIILFFSFSTEITLVIKSLFNSVFFRQLLNQQNTVINNLLIFFNILFFLSISTIGYLYLSVTKSVEFSSHLLLFLSVIGTLIVFYGWKIISSSIWAYVLDNNRFSTVYKFSIKIANVFLASFLIFFIFSAIFNPNCEVFCLKISFFLILIVFIIRLWRIFFEFFQQGFSLLYLILYLCTVEILPVLIVLKYFSIV